MDMCNSDPMLREVSVALVHHGADAMLRVADGFFRGRSGVLDVMQLQGVLAQTFQSI